MSTDTPKERIYPGSMRDNAMKLAKKRELAIREANTPLVRIPHPVSFFKAGYDYDHTPMGRFTLSNKLSVPYREPLSADEAKSFYFYEDYCRSWYLTETMAGLNARNTPYNPMGFNIWNWNRSYLATGMITAFSIFREYMFSGNAGLAAVRFACCSVYPLLASMYIRPDTRSWTLPLGAGVGILTGVYSVYASKHFRLLPARFSFVILANAFMAVWSAREHFSYPKNHRVRIYNPHVLQEYYDCATKNIDKK